MYTVESKLIPLNLSKDMSLYSFINPPNVLILMIMDRNVNKTPEVNTALYENERKMTKEFQTQVIT